MQIAVDSKSQTNDLHYSDHNHSGSHSLSYYSSIIKNKVGHHKLKSLIVMFCDLDFLNHIHSGSVPRTTGPFWSHTHWFDRYFGRIRRGLWVRQISQTRVNLVILVLIMDISRKMLPLSMPELSEFGHFFWNERMFMNYMSLLNGHQHPHIQ